MKTSLSIVFTLFALLFFGKAFSQQQTFSTPQFRREFLSIINRKRETGCTCGVHYMSPVPPLKWSYQLEVIAAAHAADMARNNYFSHTSLDGRTMQNRINGGGYTINGYRSIEIGENIAFGQESIAEVMQGWFKSAGHCRNLMNPRFKEVGIAEDSKYWVQDFGGREPFTAEQQRLLKSGRYRVVHSE